ncbi:MAG: hypothetical protein LBP73_01690 [Clostridiales Family XIII bacterium]|nr:hypothetical protein [Clostridiales Family XIII bacterium]
MENIKVEIIKYINEKPFPGIVKCRFRDAYGKEWEFIDKTAVFSTENISKKTKLPISGFICGKIVNEENGIVCFCTKDPYFIRSIEGETIFYLKKDQITVD